jgi:uracil-DNA glycosylase
MGPGMRNAYLEAMGIQPWVGRATPPLPVESLPPDGATVPEVLGGGGAMESLRSTHPPTGAPMEMAPPSPPRPSRPASGDPRPDSGVVSGPRPIAHSITGLDWPELRARVLSCTACGLHSGRTQAVFGVGDPQARLMIVGEAPGADEDRLGEPFVGRAGQLLTAMLRAIGLGRGQVYIANILKCRPPGNRDPLPEEAACCEPFLLRQVALVRPRVILAAGRVAAQHLLKSSDPVGRLRGQQHRLGDIPLLVTYHPAYLLRSPEEKAKAWQDLQHLARLLRNEDGDGGGHGRDG